VVSSPGTANCILASLMRKGAVRPQKIYRLCEEQLLRACAIKQACEKSKPLLSGNLIQVLNLFAASP